MRLLIAALLGGIIVFFWGFVAHTLLPLGEMGVQVAQNEDRVIAALKEGLPAREGAYFVPGVDHDKLSDPAVAAQYSAKAIANPNALIIYQPVGRDGMAMGPMLGIEFATNVVSAGVLAWILMLAPLSFGRRVGVSVAAGLFGWLIVSVPQWNWYRFPTDMMLSGLAQAMIGWFLAGLVMAWWLGRKRSR